MLFFGVKFPLGVFICNDYLIFNKWSPNVFLSPILPLGRHLIEVNVFMCSYSEALLSMQLPKALPLLIRFAPPYIYNVLRSRRLTDHTKILSGMLTNLTPHDLEPCLLFCLLKKKVKICCCYWPAPHILSHSLEDGVWLKWHAKPLASRPSPQIVDWIYIWL